MGLFLMIAFGIAFIAALVQLGIYQKTGKKRSLLHVPLICAAIIILILLLFVGFTIEYEETLCFFATLFFGVPAVVGGLIGAAVALLKRKKY